VTTCTRDRQKAFRDQDFCSAAREELSARAAEYDFSITTYCLMPDHTHLLLRARGERASLVLFVPEWKQNTGFAWRQRRGRPLWQKGYWDRVLRADDDVLPIARYVVENPVRAGLVADPRDYPWMGSDEYSIEEILEAAQLDLWKKWRR
jgi:REP element-mobilizing transposase RayT